MQSRAKSDYPNRKTEHGGAETLMFTFILPMIIIAVLVVTITFMVFRTVYVVDYAADLAAKSVVTSRVDYDFSHHGVTYDSDKAPIRPMLDLKWEQCRPGSQLLRNPPFDDPTKCVLRAMTEEQRLNALVWSDFPNGLPANVADKIDRAFALPFPLYEPNQVTPGFFPTQASPLQGVARACFEPYNETSSAISHFSPRCFGSSCSSGCNHIRPMYWQVPVRADFDRDQREDLMFFRPTGLGHDWTNFTDPREMDFVVYQSGTAYSAAGGLLFMNLTTATPGQEQPQNISADYDRDGLTDFAVFEPTTGWFRIAFSKTEYRTVGQGRVEISDPEDGAGLIAIPGNYLNSYTTDIAIVPTATHAPQNRYNIYIITPRIPNAQRLYDWQIGGSHQPMSLSFEAGQFTDPKYKPHPGTISVPAFVDYDRDGVTEVGYLSWFGGNMSKRIAGRVSPINSNQTIPLFETTDSIARPLNARINPFDLVQTRAGDLLVSDAVDGRIWMISGDGTRGDFAQGQVSVVVGNHSVQPARHLRGPGSFDPEKAFPRENVWNIPRDNTTLKDDEGILTAANRVLNTPRKMAIAKAYDNSLYIADFGNGRIVRVEGNLNLSSQSRIVLGSHSCVSCKEIGSLPFNSPQDRADGKFEIYPSAIEIVPDGTGRYALAFSSGYGVYLIRPKIGALGGPIGDPLEQIYRIAGVSGPVFGQRPPEPTSIVSTYRYDNGLCPVIDLKYDSVQRSLLAATSCSLGITPALIDYNQGTGHVTYNVTHDGYNIDPAFVDNPSQSYSKSLAYHNQGGIVELTPVGHDGDFSRGTTKKRILGGMWQLPCNNENTGPKKCSSPGESGQPGQAADAGVYQRKVDISAGSGPIGTKEDVRNIDLVNPVSIALGRSTGAAPAPIYFIDQWNSSQQGNPRFSDRYYPSASKRTDQQHQYGLYLLERDNNGDPRKNGIYPVSNPFLAGSGTIPVESSYWRSPYTNGGDSRANLYIEPHEAPIKNVLFPATAAVLVDLDSGKLYSSTPFLANPRQYLTESHPYKTNPSDIGFINKVDLDLDGDGSDDFHDPDPDGDGADISDGSHFCAEASIFANTKVCRAQEKLGNPMQYFVKLNGDFLKLGGDSGDARFQEAGVNRAHARYGEFYIFNSVSECGTADQCQAGDYSGRIVRPENLSTLLDFGNDQSFDYAEPNQGKVCNTDDETSDRRNPYYLCSKTSNGPIATPQALHSVSGSPVSGYAGAGFYKKVFHSEQEDNQPANSFNDGRDFLYPTILSSTQPRENGIKPTRTLPAYIANRGTEPARIDSNGALCRGGSSDSLRGYTFQIYNQPERVTFNEGSNPGFSLNLDNYLQSYQFSGLKTPQEDAHADNDNLNYMVSCDLGASGWQGNSAIEGVVLQLNHDDTLAKESGNSAEADWPNGQVAGDPSQPENLRQFFFLDTDGDGIGNPTWLTSDALPIAGQTRDFYNRGAYSLVSTDLKDSLNMLHGTGRLFIHALDEMRQPFDDPNITRALGITLAPTYYGAITSPIYGKDSNSHGGNYSFDKGKHAPFLNTDSGQRAYSGTFIVGLDFEPWLARKYGIKEVRSIGASMFNDYTTSNRFSMDSNNLSPGLVVAENILKLGLNAKEFTVGSDLNLEIGTGHVSFLYDNPSNPFEPAPGGKPYPTKIQVGYVVPLLWKIPIPVITTKNLDETQLLKNVPRCDSFSDPNCQSNR